MKKNIDDKEKRKKSYSDFQEKSDSQHNRRESEQIVFVFQIPPGEAANLRWGAGGGELRVAPGNIQISSLSPSHHEMFRAVLVPDHWAWQTLEKMVRILT